MKLLLATFFVLTYVSLGLLGVVGMHAPLDMQGHDAASNCISALAQGINCPKQADLLAFAAFHIETLKSFFLAAFSDDVMRQLVFTLFGALLASFIFLRFQFKPPLSPSLKCATVDHHAFPLTPQLRHWLSLHENSPSFS